MRSRATGIHSCTLLTKVTQKLFVCYWRAGADKDWAGNEGRYHRPNRASGTGHVEVVRLLLEAGQIIT